MKKIIILLTIVALLASCQSKKQIVKTDTEIKTSAEQQSTKTEDSKSDVKIDKTIAESITENDSSVIEETVVKLSEPDSTGKQHTESITTRVITSGKNKKTETETKEEVAKVTENKVAETKKENNDQELTSETDTKTVKKQLRGKVYALLGGLAALVFLVFKLKGGLLKKILK